MAIQKLSSGRFRAVITHPVTGRRVSAADVLGLPQGQSSFRTKTEARTMCEAALVKIREEIAAADSPLLSVFHARWISDPLFARDKESTNIHNRERTKKFVERYGHLRLDQITDSVAAEWIAGGQNLGTVKVLCTFFNDAGSKRAAGPNGRLIAYNPFAGMGISKGRGRKDEQPPTEAQVWEMIGAARRITNPGFAAWLQVGCFTGMRPGELDALKWDDVDFGGGWLRVDEQFNAKTRTFTLPKNGKVRSVVMTDEAREALMSVRGQDPVFCFTNLHGQHWTPSSRAYHWNAVRAAVGWEKSLYLATRHFAGWLMYEVMGLHDEDVGNALGHSGRDVGKLVRETYGHRSIKDGLQRVRDAMSGRKRGDNLQAA